MLLDCVLTATNQKYSGFIPLFIKTWKKIAPDTDTKVVFVGDVLPAHLRKFSQNLIHFRPLPGVSTGLTAQYIRLLYPALLPYKNSVLVSDIDMMPLNRPYYFDSIAKLKNDRFVHFRDLDLDRQYAICYNAASPATWAEIFGIQTIDDLETKLRETSSSTEYEGRHGGSGWTTDQEALYEHLLAWPGRNERFVQLSDRETGFRRLCRTGPQLKRGGWRLFLDAQSRARIRRGHYSDFHALTPHERHSFVNRFVCSLVLETSN